MRNPDPHFDAFDPALLDPMRRARKLDGRRRLTPGQRVVVLGGIGNSFAAKYGTTGLISYWKLDEASGTRIDSFGANNLTDNNTVTQAAGKLGSAAQCTLANLEKLTSTSSSLRFASGSFTLALWVYLDTKAAQCGIFSRNDVAGGTEYQLEYLDSSDRFRFAISDGTNAPVAVADNLGSPSTGTWYYIIAWRNVPGDTVNIQVNDGTVNSATDTTTADLQDLGTVAIGGYGAFGTLTLDGRADSAAVWNRVLTAAERSYLYNNGAGRPILGSE